MQHPTKVDARIANAKFEIAKVAYTGSLTFTKLKRDVISGESATITATQLMSQIAGATSKGFTLKSVTLDDNSLATVSGTKPNFTLTLKRRGNFTAVLVLEHATYVDVTINNAQFESILPNDRAEITSWKFGDGIAQINGAQISVKLPLGTDVTALKASIELSEGATISPDPTQSKDYTNPIDFKVTAQDKTTTKTYKVTVSLDHVVTSCTGGWRNAKAYPATINHNPAVGNITLDVDSADFEIDLTLLPGARITPDPQGITDWTSTQRFTVSMGSFSKKYDVTVTVKGKKIIKVNTANIKATMKAEITKYGDTADYNYIDVSEVTSMISVFQGSILESDTFNGDIGKWDVSKVTSMEAMFKYAVSFNQDIGKWDVSKVTKMGNMFKKAKVFNQPIGDWTVSNVTVMEAMFSSALVFNQPIGNWTVNNVTNMQSMFKTATAFNQPIGNWTVNNVTNMVGMFASANSFNQPIGNWTVSNVTDMESMFAGALAFNQDISGWDMGNVTKCRTFSKNSALKDENKPNLKNCGK